MIILKIKCNKYFQNIFNIFLIFTFSLQISAFDYNNKNNSLENQMLAPKSQALEIKNYINYEELDLTNPYINQILVKLHANEGLKLPSSFSTININTNRNEELEISPLYLYQLSQMTNEQLTLIVEEYEKQTRQYHKKIRETFLSRFYSSDELNKIVKYETIIAKKAKNILEAREREQSYRAIGNMKEGYGVLEDNEPYLKGESDSLQSDKKKGEIIPFPKRVNPFPDNKNILIFKKINSLKDDIYKTSPLQETRKNVAEILKVLETNPNIIITNFFTPANGVISFGRPESKVFGKAYFYKVPNEYINKPLVIEFKNGEPNAVYSKDLIQLFKMKTEDEINESLVNIHILKEKWQNLISKDKPISKLNQQAKTVSNDIDSILKENPNVIFSNYSLGSRGELFLQGKHIWHIKRGYENQKVFLVFKNAKLDSVYSENFKKIFDSNQKLISRNIKVGVHLKNEKWQQNVMKNTPIKTIKKTNSNIFNIINEYSNVIISNYPLRSDKTLHINNEYIGQYKNHDKVHLEFHNGKLIRVWSEDLKISYDVISDETKINDLKAKVFLINSNLDDESVLQLDNPFQYFDQSMKDSKDILQKLLDENDNILISDYELRSNGGLFLMGEFVFTENSKYQQKNGIKEKVYLRFKNKKLISIKDSSFQDIPFKIKENEEIISLENIKDDSTKTHTNKKNLVQIFKHESSDIKTSMEGSVISSFYQINAGNLKNILKKNRNIVVSNFMLNKNGGFTLFDEDFKNKIFWYENNKLKYAKVHLEFRDGIFYKMYDESFNVIFENKKTNKINNITFYPLQYNNEELLIFNNPLETIKNNTLKHEAVEQLILKNPNLIIKGFTLNSQGRLYLGKKILPKSSGYITPDSIKGSKEKYAYEEVILIFKNGQLFQILDTSLKLLHQVKTKYEISQNLLMLHTYSDNWKNEIFTNQPLEKVEKSSANINNAIIKYKNFIVRNFILPPEGRLYIDGKEIFNKKQHGNQPIIIIYKNEELFEIYTETLEKIYPDNILIYKRTKDWKKGIFKNKSKPLISSKKDSSIILDALKRNNGSIIISNFLTQSKGRVYIKEELWSNTDYEYKYVTLEFEDFDLIGIYNENEQKIYDGTPYVAYELHENTIINLKNKYEIPNNKIKYNRSNDNYLEDYIQENPNVIISNFRLNDKGGLKIFGKYIFNSKANFENEKVFLEFKNGKLTKVYDKDLKLIHETLNESLEILKSMEANGDLKTFAEVFGISTTTKIILKLYNNLPYNWLSRAVLTILNKNKNITLWHTNNTENFFLALKNIETYFELNSTNHIKIILDELILASYKYFVKDPNFIKTLQKEQIKLNEDSQLKTILNDIINFYTNNQLLDIKGLKLPLKFYQKIGVNFILKNKNAILGDEPGLGKSLTALAAAINAYDGEGAKKILIISPRISKKNVWIPEIKKHLKGFHKTCVLDYTYQINSKKKLKEIEDARFVIVHYDLLTDTFEATKKLKETLLQYNFDFIIMDEGHKIRNNALFKNAVAGFDAPYKVILTGTPLVGRFLRKLYPLINWIRPDLFQNKEEFSKLTSLRDGVTILKNLLSDVILRRLTEDVMVEYPKLNISTDYLPMTTYQENAYYQINKNISTMHPDTRIAGLQQLKLAATSPGLIKTLTLIDTDLNEYQMKIGSNDIIINNEIYHVKYELGKVNAIEKRDGLKIIESYPIKDRKFILKNKVYDIITGNLYHDSVKINEVEKLINIAKEKNEKIVIFTGYINILNHIKKLCEEKDYPVNILHGSMNESKRNASINEFNSSSGFSIMIATYQTGGESINLSAAKYGVLIDTPWTFQERKQIFHRLYRMGIKEDVIFHILATKKTIDEYAEMLSSQAEILEAIIIDDNNFDTIKSDSNITNKLLEIFFRRTKHKTSIINEDNSYTPKAITTIVEKNDMYLEYDSEAGYITGELNNYIHVDFELLTFEKFFKDKDLSELLRQLIYKHIKKEIKSDINPKKTILYNICKVAIPYFSENDFDYNIVETVKNASILLMHLLKNPEIEIENLRNKCGFSNDEIFKETLIYITDNNIINYFILINVLPQNFKINDLQSKYIKNSSSKNVYPSFRIGEVPSLLYKDEKRLEEIVTSETYNKMKGYLELTSEQKIELAKEALKGNNSATKYLIKYYITICEKVVKKANNLLKAYNPKAKKLDIYDELLSSSNLLLIERFKEYVENWGWVTIEPDDYIITMLFKDLCKYGTAYLKDNVEYNLDEPYFKDSPKKESKIDKVSSTEPSPSDIYEEKELLNNFDRFLRQNSFSELEINIISAFYRNEIDSKEISTIISFNDETSKNAIEKFRNFISDYDSNEFIEQLSNPSAPKSEGALKVMGTYLDDETLSKIANKSEQWKKEAMTIKTETILLQVEPFSNPIKLFMKILYVEDNELPQNVYSWNLSGDPKSQDNPLIIVVKKNLINLTNENSKDLLYETIYHEYRENYWQKNLYEEEPTFSKKEVMRLSHILAASEQLLKYSPLSTINIAKINKLKAKAILEAKKNQLQKQLEEELEFYNILTFRPTHFYKNSRSYPLIIKDFDPDEMREILIIDENFYKHLTKNPLIFKEILYALNYDAFQENSIDKIKYFIAEYFFNSFINKHNPTLIERTTLVNQISEFISEFADNEFYLGSINIGRLDNLWVDIAATYLTNEPNLQKYRKTSILNTAA